MENLPEVVQTIWTAVQAWWVVLPAVISAAAAVAALTPTPKDDAWLSKVRKVIDVLALNVANAKNKGVKP